VAYTIDLMRDPASPVAEDMRALWSTVSVAVTGTQTVALTLPEPFAPFLDYTSFGVLPRHILSGSCPAISWAIRLRPGWLRLRSIFSRSAAGRSSSSVGGLEAITSSPGSIWRPSLITSVVSRLWAA